MDERTKPPVPPVVPNPSTPGVQNPNRPSGRDSQTPKETR